MNSASYEYRICRLGEGHSCAHGNANYLVEKLSCEDHENVVNQKLEHPDDVFFGVQFLRMRVIPYKMAVEQWLEFDMKRDL